MRSMKRIGSHARGRAIPGRCGAALCSPFGCDVRRHEGRRAQRNGQDVAVDESAHLAASRRRGSGPQPTEWSLEGGSPNSLSRQGWRSTTFKPGDVVTRAASADEGRHGRGPLRRREVRRRRANDRELAIAARASFDEARLLADCREHAVDLLKRNLTPAGVLAASPSERAAARGYTAIFGARRGRLCARHGDFGRPRARARGRHGPRDARGASGAERPDPEVRRSGQARGGFLVSRLHRCDALVADRARVSRRA